MLILLIILQVTPPLIAVLLYERFRGYALTDRKRGALMLVFAFLINLFGYAAMWVRGWEYHNWSIGASSSMTSIPFVLKYMLISLLAAVVMAFVLSLFRFKPAAGAGGRKNAGDGEAEASK